MAPMKVSKKSSSRASIPPALLLRVANERDHVFEVLDDFDEKTKQIVRQTDSGLSLRVSCFQWKSLPDDLQQFVIDLTEGNMKELYENSAWGWNRAGKVNEFKHDTAKIMVVHDVKDVTQPIACVHFRYEEGYADDAALYCYELQVSPDYHRKGIGKCLMNILAELARKNKIKKILITVLKENTAAKEFYTKTLDFVSDKHSPDRCGEDRDYEILMQRILETTK